ncbi:membrane protein [Salmonella enterica subsp. enterica serovar Typhimurium]|nr:membrane protein [Salmonella enterica subsp. enterica serovar Typhimurium]
MAAWRLSATGQRCCRIVLLALGAQYGWQLAGMMLLGAALMRSGWLKGQYSLRHYRRTGLCWWR